MRYTAQGVSLQAAQDEFKAASQSLRNKALGWSILSIGAFTAFLVVATIFYRHTAVPQLASSVSPASALAQTAYLAAIRVAILTAIASIAAFGLKMLRAHLHMAEVNHHRRRVANSMSAFIESASSPEQRDLILGRLIDAVVAFGDSGILGKENENPAATAIAIEAVGKTLSSK